MDLSRAPTQPAAALVARKLNGRWLHCLDERTKCEPLCQFCVSWHTLSWSVPAEIAEMAETGNQTKTWIYADFTGLFREKNWCCQTGLNCRPLHYQWSALPLSYGSMPGYENRPKRPLQGGPILATRPEGAQARGPAARACQTVEIGPDCLPPPSAGSVAGRSGRRFLARCPNFAHPVGFSADRVFKSLFRFD